MAKPLVDDALWERIQPLLPPAKPRRKRYGLGRGLTAVVQVAKALPNRRSVRGALYTWSDAMGKNTPTFLCK